MSKNQRNKNLIGSFFYKATVVLVYKKLFRYVKSSHCREFWVVLIVKSFLFHPRDEELILTAYKKV